MPYKVEKDSSCPKGKPWACKKADGSKKFGCHASKVGAEKQCTAIRIREGSQLHTLLGEPKGVE